MEVRIECGPCRLRDLDPRDAPSIARHANNRNVSRQLRDRFPFPYALTHAEHFIAHVRAETPPSALAIDVGGEAIGTIGVILQSDIERASAEVGYWIGEPFWGRGIAPAALRAFVTWVFAHHAEVWRVYACAFDGNEGSARVLEKAGFLFEARLRCSAVKDGRVVDQLMYARMRIR